VRVRHRALYLGRQREHNERAHARIAEQGLAQPGALAPDDPLAAFLPALATAPASKVALRAASQAAEEATRAAGEASGTGSSQWDLYALRKWGVDLSRCPRCGKPLHFSLVPPRRASLPGSAVRVLARARAGLAPRAPPTPSASGSTRTSEAAPA
jgi:hypothetical protein